MHSFLDRPGTSAATLSQRSSSSLPTDLSAASNDFCSTADHTSSIFFATPLCVGSSLSTPNELARINCFVCSSVLRSGGLGAGATGSLLSPLQLLCDKIALNRASAIAAVHRGSTIAAICFQRPAVPLGTFSAADLSASDLVRFHLNSEGLYAGMT